MPDLFRNALAAARWRPLALAAALAAATCAQAQSDLPAAPAPGQPPATVVNAQTADTGQRPSGNVTLDFAGAEIDAVARTMATITGRNVVVDPRVKGTMTLTTTTPVPPAQALDLFAAQLRAQGFALVDSGGLYLVLPEAEAKLQGGAVSAGPAPSAGGQIMTRIFRLTHENANSLVPILRPLISPNNTINVSPGTNALVITDYADNLQRLGRIIAALDIANATGVEIVRLRYAVASDLAPLVAKLLEPGGGGGAAALPQQPAPGLQGGAQAAALSVGGGDGYHTTLAPEPRSNAIIVRAANPARLALAKTLIEQLDQPPAGGADGGGSNIHVVFLKNADAAKLAMTLRAALAALPGQAQSGNGGGSGAATGGGLTANPASQMMNTSSTGSSSMSGLGSGPTINAAANNQPSTGGPIQADPSSNSLIISAPEPVYRELRGVIDQLDQRRAQVFVESLIAEINTDREADFGIQWQALMKNGSGSAVGVLGTNFSTPGGGAPNIFGFASQFYGINHSDWTPPANGLTYPGPGFNLIAGAGSLGVLANFIQSSGAGNVLSTPTLLTLDNEEAKIMVGQNVPIVTGSYTNTGASTTSVSPFQTYDRQDVGLMLRVRPQISEDGTIKLVIYQELSDMVTGTATSATGPTTNKRSIESSVLVNDGAIVVLGGLLQDRFSSVENKVPMLGDVPLLGNLFKSRNRGLTKTDLMVFLRPVIVRDAAAAERYSLDRYELMRSAQKNTQPEPSVALPINQSPMLPPLAPVSPQTPARPAPPPPMIAPVGGSSDYDRLYFAN